MQNIHSHIVSTPWLPLRGLKGPCFVAGGGTGGRGTGGACGASVGRCAGGAQEAGGGVGREHAGALPAAQGGAVRDMRRGRAAGRCGADNLALKGFHVHAEGPRLEEVVPGTCSAGAPAATVARTGSHTLLASQGFPIRAMSPVS